MSANVASALATIWAALGGAAGGLRDVVVNDEGAAFHWRCPAGALGTTTAERQSAR